MNTYEEYYGIDVSKDTFDVATKNKHLIYPNTKEGFRDFISKSSMQGMYAMEVTGVYHLQLAQYLYKAGVSVSVIQPLRVKRYIQMHLKRNKTDKADAKMIRSYAESQCPKLWEPKNELLEESNDLYAAMEQCIEAKASFKNILSTLKSKNGSVIAQDSIASQIEELSKTIAELEEKLIEKIKEYDSELLSLICSIKGIGVRTALLLIISTNGFSSFEKSKNLCSYFGIAPTTNQSGSSIRRRGRISKMGNPLVRKKLYMCSYQASRHNISCKNLYDRLVAKGKSKKLARVAVMNKLVRIVFAIAKNRITFDNNYRSTKPNR